MSGIYGYESYISGFCVDRTAVEFYAVGSPGIYFVGRNLYLFEQPERSPVVGSIDEDFQWSRDADVAVGESAEADPVYRFGFPEIYGEIGGAVVPSGPLEVGIAVASVQSVGKRIGYPVVAVCSLYLMTGALLNSRGSFSVLPCCTPSANVAAYMVIGLSTAIVPV